MERIMLGNRYELLEKVGDGGMAQVYKAKCHLLNRFVAIKMLKSDFTNDEEFVKRFGNESQAAASLSHPNIVSIYDVGHEGEMSYIVMEYIDGITLSEYIKQNVTIPWQRALEISIQVCSALFEAHKKGIIHRDIKPQNILMTSDGVAKVADFGIARAVNSTTITMSGNTIGSVHYFSPEQARGGYVDEKSDLYSLGVTMYQMLTGHLPFDGDTPIAIALKHLQELPRPPIELNPDIPKAVNAIVVKAMQKVQDARYQSAKDMLDDLNSALANPEGDFVVEANAQGLTTNRINVISAGADENAGDDALSNSKKSKSKAKGKKAKSSDRNVVWIAGLISLFLIIAITVVTILIVFPPSDGNNGGNFVTGDYVGRNFYEVRDELKAAGINATETLKFNPDVAKDIIIYQSVSKNKQLKEGYTIEFEVSQGVGAKQVPSLRDVDYREAEATLKALMLNVVFVDEYSDTIAFNRVTRTMPEAGSDILAGTEIALYRSKGSEPETIKAPNLVGKTVAEAKTELERVGLKLGSAGPSSSGTAKVKSQNPLAGTEMRKDMTVDVTTEQTT